MYNLFANSILNRSLNGLHSVGLQHIAAINLTFECLGYWHSDPVRVVVVLVVGAGLGVSDPNAPGASCSDCAVLSVLVQVYH